MDDLEEIIPKDSFWYIYRQREKRWKRFEWWVTLILLLCILGGFCMAISLFLYVLTFQQGRFSQFIDFVLLIAFGLALAAGFTVVLQYLHDMLGTELERK